MNSIFLFFFEFSICEGEERKLIIPPSFAYGDVGASNVIPPGSTLLMDVKCEKILRGKQSNTSQQ